MGVTPIEKLLPKLDKVKRVKAGKWTACCPAHHDRTPSLNIRETQDGTVLIKCWTGCNAAQIVDAVGLELRDLFPARIGKPRKPGPSRDAIIRELAIVAAGNAQLAKKAALNSEDQARFYLALARLELLEVKP